MVSMKTQVRLVLLVVINVPPVLIPHLVILAMMQLVDQERHVNVKEQLLNQESQIAVFATTCVRPAIIPQLV